MVLEAIRKRGWRRAVGLIAAYALALQAFLAHAALAQAAATGALSQGGAFFIVCVSHDGDAVPGDAGAPVKTASHCPTCTLAAGAGGIVPDAVPLPKWRPGASEQASPVSVANGIFIHRARAGLTRAPPAMV